MIYHTPRKYDAVTSYDLTCSECKKVVPGAIEFVQDESYEITYICLACLETAVALCEDAALAKEQDGPR